MITRRKLLQGGLGLALVVVSAGVAVRAASPRTEDAIARIVRHYLGKERLHPQAASAFAAEYAATTKKLDWRVASAMALGIYFLPSFRNALPDSAAYRINRLDRRIVSDFLLSSDYDPNDPPLTKIEHIAYDSERACNPFARFV